MISDSMGGAMGGGSVMVSGEGLDSKRGCDRWYWYSISRWGNTCRSCRLICDREGSDE